MQNDKTSSMSLRKTRSQTERVVRTLEPSAGQTQSTSQAIRTYSLVPESRVLHTFASPALSGVIYQQAPKSTEATRQIRRIFAAKRVAGQIGEDVPDSKMSDDNTKHVIELINSFIGSPIDIPTASIDIDGAPSLFLRNENIYLDLTVVDKRADYYIRLKSDGGSTEIFDQEDIDGNYVPPRLLGKLILALKNK